MTTTFSISLDTDSVEIIKNIALEDERSTSDLIRNWIRNGMIESPFFEKANTKGISTSQLCEVSHGRPKKVVD